MNEKFKNVEFVMGWDIGDGDTVAFARSVRGSAKEMFPLYIHKSRSEQVVKSAVSKQSNGMVLIGNDAATQQSFQINFKRPPGKWNNKSEQKIEYRQHMFDFIRGVSEAILNNSSNRTKINSAISIDEKAGARWKADKVLLVVGCPAAKIWKGKENRKQYEDLISKATGISNVIVVEESRAAIFSLFALDDLRAKINLQGGILVLDFGSSTVDATCIIPGEKAIHLSWELGAAQIERAMLQYILDGDKTQKALIKQAKVSDRKRVLIDEGECNHAVFQLRCDKEDYFDGKRDANTVPDQICLYMIDENGDLLVDDGEPVPLTVMYKITPEMMNYAIGKYRFDARKDNVVVSSGTWEQNCRNFLLAVKLLLEKNKITVRSVVVTGGGSSMPFVVNLAKDVFGFHMVVSSDTPSHSVVRGLTTIAYNSLNEEDVRKNAVDSVLKSSCNQVNETISKIAYNLAAKAYDDAISALDDSVSYASEGGVGSEGIGNRKQTVGDITKTIRDALNNSLKQNGSRIITAELKNWGESDKKLIVDTVNRAADEMYSDNALQDMIHIDSADIDTIKSNLNLPNVSIPDIGADANIIGKIIGVVLTMVLAVVLAIIAFAVPGIGFTFVVLGSIIGGSTIIEWMKKREGFPVPHRCAKSAVKKMKSNKVTELGQIKQAIYDEIEKTFTAESVYGKDFHKHYTVLKETTNRAFDRILLIAEDNE